ncbi:MAG: cytochrome C [Bacteroidetes bacterium]|nr:cytochrome C [Bacteroidota bacterium]
MSKLFFSIFLFCFILSDNSLAQVCIDCHYKETPNIVNDWQLSKHAENEIYCETCHGENHQGMDDIANVELPTVETCAMCHDEKAEEFKKSKHALAWTAMKAMPTAHMQPMALMDGMKGCGGCHKMGIKSDDEINKLKSEGSMFGHASCDICHTRHSFSVKEAQQPQACQTCHMGFDHPQWEMYSSSKHGVRYMLKQAGVLHPDTPAPTCQTCHMPDGDHNVLTAWGFLAVRLPLPKDEQWAADRVTILQALGVLDLEGNPTARLDAVKAVNLARLTEEAFDRERNKMKAVCADCHSANFTDAELAKGDDMIREADRMMAEGIKIIAGLYEDGTIPKPDSYSSAFPDLLTFHDAPTVIEQKLFRMFFKHRMRAFQGAFHMNPDYSFWYGWSELVTDLAEMKELAEQMRKK